MTEKNESELVEIVELEGLLKAGAKALGVEVKINYLAYNIEVVVKYPDGHVTKEVFGG